MAERRVHYYIDGSTVRKIEEEAAPVKRQAEPVRKREPERKRRLEAAPVIRQNDRRWVDELKYGVFLTCAAVCAVGLCFVLLKMNADVKEAKNQVSSLQSQLDEQLSANAEYSSGLDSMTDLEEIYEIATTELGMTYSKPGQTVYYSQSSDDYVVQYKNVPEAN